MTYRNLLAIVVFLNLGVLPWRPSRAGGQPIDPDLSAVVVAGNPGAFALSGPEGCLAVSGACPARDVTLTFPTSLAVDPTTQDVYVNNSHSFNTATLVKVDDDGQASPFGSYPFPGQVFPFGHEIDGDGNHYTFDAGAGLLWKIDPSGSYSIDAAGLHFVWDLALDPTTGDRYVLERANFDDLDGKVWRVKGGVAEVVVSGLPFFSTFAIEVEPVSGDVFVSTFFEVLRFAPDGGQVDSYFVDGLPFELLLDGAAQELYFTNLFTSKIQKLSLATAAVTDVVGSGLTQFNGDGPPASTNLAAPDGLAFRGTELYWSEEGNQLVRKLDLASPASTQTVLGIGTNIQAGSRFQATQVSLTSPSDVACCDPAGHAFIADELNSLVYRLSPDGYLSIAAGIPGREAFEPPIEGVPATQSPLARPGALALDAAGDLFIADAGQGGLIQKVVASTGHRFTLVAPGTFSYPGALATGPGRSLYVADLDLGHVFRVDLDTGTVTTIADAFATGLAVDAGGNLFLAEPDDDRIRRMTPGVDGIVNGGADELITTAASLPQPFDLVFGADGKAYVAQMLAGVIQKIEPGADGKLTGAPDEITTTIAGNGLFPAGFQGDGGPALAATIPARALAVDGSGNLLAADAALYNVVWRINLDGELSDPQPHPISLSSPSGTLAIDLDVVGLESPQLDKHSITLQAINVATNRHGPKVAISSSAMLPPDPDSPDVAAGFRMTDVHATTQAALSTTPGATRVNLRVEGVTKNLLGGRAFTGDVAISVQP